MQNSYRKTQSKTKQKQKTNKEMFCLVTKSNCSVFFSTFQITSFWIAVPWPQRLSVKPTISLLLKNAIDLLLCFEHKLYGFAQSDISEFKIRCRERRRLTHSCTAHVWGDGPEILSLQAKYRMWNTPFHALSKPQQKG